MKLNTAKRLLVAAAMLATLAASSVNAAPAQNNSARICTAWQNSCIQYRYIFGIRYCTAWRLTCIRWL